jgi:hypothetical protein
VGIFPGLSELIKRDIYLMRLIAKGLNEETGRVRILKVLSIVHWRIKMTHNGAYFSEIAVKRIGVDVVPLLDYILFFICIEADRRRCRKASRRIC